MSDANAIAMVIGRIVFSLLMATFIAGSIYIFVDLVFGEKGNIKITKIIENSSIVMLVIIAALVFVNVPAITKSLIGIVIVSASAASVYSFLRWPLRMNDNNAGFWVFFLVVYSSIVYFLLKEVLK